MSEPSGPLVSVCIPTYNSAATIRETLASIVSQSYANLDIRIVDNASSDDTLNVVAAFNDPRIKIHRSDINVGAEENFNRCIRLAAGKYTAIFHADDIYEPGMVESQVVFLEAHPEAGVVFTEARSIDDSGRVFGEIRFPAGLGSFDALYDFETLFKAVLRQSNFLICPSAMARTDVYQQEIKRWRGEMFKSSADLDVWLRIAQKHKVGLLPMPLLRYRIGANQYSAKVRLQTGRPDFFLVTEHYLAERSVRESLDKYDLQGYARLERRDRVMRAVNWFICGNAGNARGLLGDIYSRDALKAALQDKRGLGVLIAGVYLRMLLLFRLDKFGRFTLGYMKRVMRK